LLLEARAFATVCLSPALSADLRGASEIPLPLPVGDLDIANPEADGGNRDVELRGNGTDRDSLLPP
jgi:hypothetical protein